MKTLSHWIHWAWERSVKSFTIETKVLCWDIDQFSRANKIKSMTGKNEMDNVGTFSDHGGLIGQILPTNFFIDWSDMQTFVRDYFSSEKSHMFSKLSNWKKKKPISSKFCLILSLWMLSFQFIPAIRASKCARIPMASLDRCHLIPMEIYLTLFEITTIKSNAQLSLITIDVRALEICI